MFWLAVKPTWHSTLIVKAFRLLLLELYLYCQGLTLIFISNTGAIQTYVFKPDDSQDNKDELIKFHLHFGLQQC